MLGQARLVVIYQGDDISAGHVAVVDDRESGGVAEVLDVEDVARRNRRSNRACVEKIGKREIVDVAGHAAHLLDPVFAENVSSDSLQPARGFHRAALYEKRLARKPGPTSARARRTLPTFRDRGGQPRHAEAGSRLETHGIFDQSIARSRD